MKFGRTLARYLYAYLIGGIVMWLCHFVFLRTLCCAVFGEDYGLWAAAIVRYLCWPLIAFWMIYVSKTKDIIAKQAYLHRMEGRTYSFGTDAAEILRGSTFWKEVAVVLILTVIYCLVNPLLLIINMPLFLLFHFWSNVYLHHVWIKNRLHE